MFKKTCTRKVLLRTVLAAVLTLVCIVSIGAAESRNGQWSYNGGWRYYDEAGVMQAGWLTLDDGIYFLGQNGIMRTGWMSDDGQWYYFNGSGRMQTGWVRSGSSWYYMAEDGVMQTGWVTMDDGVHYLTSGGSAYRGWKLIDGQWYYFDATGCRQTGWIQSGGAWYYMDENGVMRTGEVITEDGAYLLSENGKMYTGWATWGDDYVYYTPEGPMALGWQWINGDRYYFYQEGDGYGGRTGTMAVDTVIDGETIKADGTRITTAEINMKEYAQEFSSKTDYLIMIDDENTKLGVFRGTEGNWELEQFWSCTCGAYSWTPHGTFSIKSKGYYFISYGVKCYYYSQFYGSYLIHSTLYTPSGAAYDGRLGMHLSHGCVRLSIENAKWVYDNVPIGSTVVVY